MSIWLHIKMYSSMNYSSNVFFHCSAILNNLGNKNKSLQNWNLLIKMTPWDIEVPEVEEKLQSINIQLNFISLWSTSISAQLQRIT